MKLLTEHTPSCLLYTYPAFIHKYITGILRGFRLGRDLQIETIPAHCKCGEALYDIPEDRDVRKTP